MIQPFDKDKAPGHRGQSQGRAQKHTSAEFPKTVPTTAADALGRTTVEDIVDRYDAQSASRQDLRDISGHPEGRPERPETN
jgi:hypothetical protein